MNPTTILLLVIVAALISGVYFYNLLIRLRNLVNEAYSGIDVQFKRRHDLIPNLIETIKGYQRHERSTLEELTKLRTRLTEKHPLEETSALETNFSRTLKGIFAIAENYPELKADKNFLALQNTLTEIEDHLQMARRYYNGTVRNYNIAVQAFPGNVVAGMFKFSPLKFFEIEYATERQTPDVKFN